MAKYGSWAFSIIFTIVNLMLTASQILLMYIFFPNITARWSKFVFAHYNEPTLFGVNKVISDVLFALFVVVSFQVMGIASARIMCVLFKNSNPVIRE